MEYYTPSSVAELIVSLAEIEPGMSVHDPACGWGQLLVKAGGTLRENHGDLELSGQEINYELWATCKLNVALHGYTARLALGDTLTDPQFVENGVLEHFDRVVCDPPFGLWKARVEVAQGEAYQRFAFGAPPPSSTNFAFIQHAYAALKPGGKAVILIPQSALSRSGREQAIREKMLARGVITAVIWLPSTFTRTQLATAVVVISKCDRAAPHSSVLLIDASRAGPLDPDLIRRIAKSVNSAAVDPGLGRAVSWGEIKGERFNLNVPLYVWETPVTLPPDLQEYHVRVAALAARQEQLAATVDSLIESVARQAAPHQ